MAKVETMTYSKADEVADAKRIVKELLQTAIREKRQLDVTEERKLSYYQKIIKENEKGNDKMEKNLELREFENFLKDETQKTYVENRAGETLLANNGAVVPQYLAQQIVMKLNEQASLFADMMTYQTVNGELSVPRENAGNLSDLVFVGENVKLTPTAIQFDAVKVPTKRVGTAIKLTDQFLLESGVALLPYVTDLLVRRLTKGLDFHAIKGTDAVQGLDTLTVGEHGIAEKKVTAVTANDFIDMVAMMKPAYLAGAKFVMSRRMFANVSKLTDAGGAYILVLNFQQDRPVYRILGVEVQISDAMDDDKVYLVNMQEAYAKVIRNAVRVKRVTDDEENALSATQLFILDMFVGAKCVNGEPVCRMVVQA